MHRNLRLSLAALGIAAGLGATALPMLPAWQSHDLDPALVDPMTVVDGRTTLVVDLKDNANDAERADIERAQGIRLTPNSIEAKDNKLFVAEVPAARAKQILAALRADSRVEAAEPQLTLSLSPEEMAARQAGDDPHAMVRRALTTLRLETRNGRTVVLQERIPIAAARPTPFDDDNAGTKPNDPRYDEQWNFKMIGAEDAWKKTRGKGAVVAVIDTGVSGQDMAKGKACRDFNTTSFVKGYDFVNKDDQPFDDHAHGTHVAGTIAESTNNNEGVAGLAYEATIMPLKVLSAGGSGTSADIADAIRWAADHGANVINMSLGSAFPDNVIHNACKYAAKKGVVIVCAAGNSFREGVGYPAAFPECIAVSSVGPSGNLAKYSSWGKQVALAAPGGDYIDSGDQKDGILQNTLMGGKDDYYAFQGTSMACPHVAAAAALAVSQGIKDPAKVRDLLCKTATPRSDKKKYGAGVLNVGKLVKTADAEKGDKTAVWMLLGLGGMMVAFGGRRRNLPLRVAMAGALGVGLFGPDLMTRLAGYDSAWNLLTFSALIPGALALAWRSRPAALKLAASGALGTGLCLFTHWSASNLPFTTATFGAAAQPWTLANLAVALGVAVVASLTAARRMR